MCKAPIGTLAANNGLKIHRVCYACTSSQSSHFDNIEAANLNDDCRDHIYLKPSVSVGILYQSGEDHLRNFTSTGLCASELSAEKQNNITVFSQVN
jgi:hypothetical protein